MPGLENTLGRWYSAGGPPLLAAQPFAVHQMGAGEILLAWAR